MRKVIVMGGSAGGIEALCEVLKGVPTGFAVPLFTVIHIGERETLLPNVLQRCTGLQVVSPQKPEPIASRHMYVAPPNRHLAIHDGCVLAAHGPRENRLRPAVDVLFRSAARTYRKGVIAVILSGALDDGVAGCLAVEARGGAILVQDPREAMVPDMPRNVLKQIKTARALATAKIAELMVELGRDSDPFPEAKPGGDGCPEVIGEENLPLTEPITYTCPDCGGSLLQIDHGASEQFRCNTGHIFSLECFTVAHANAVERALWMAMQRLNERRTLEDHLSERIQDHDLRRRHKEIAAAAAEDIRLLKEILVRL